MQMTASQAGMSAVAAALDQEEERRRRMEGIVGMVSGRWGFVSRQGMERAAGRLGLGWLWDDEVRKNTLTVAGIGVLVDVGFAPGEKWEEGNVRSVVVQFEGSGKGVRGLAGAVGHVLESGLRGDGRGYVGLEGFARNLERLAGMDRLGGWGISCFDAVDGLFRGLKRVFGWEVGKATEQREKGAEEEVLCRYSGLPRMHTRRRVGLALQFWVEKRLLAEKEKSTDEMDIDKPTANEDEAEAPIWTAIIECEASPADLYPSIRVSDAWVTESVQKLPPADPTSLPLDDSPIDWQEPPPTFLSPQSPTNRSGAMNIDSIPDSQPKLPDVRFVAKFEPAVIVPLQLAIEIHQSVGAPLSQDMLLPTTYESLIFSDADAETPPLTAPRTTEKAIDAYDPSKDTTTLHRHRNTLLTQPQDFARAITHLPFSHPRQIIAILPTLRQWALTASIVRRSFMPESPSDDLAPTSNGGNATNGHDSESATFQTLDAELEDFMSSPLPSYPASVTNGASSDKVKTVDMTLTTTPLPRLVFSFRNPRYGGKLASVGFNIGVNGTVEGVAVDDGSPPWHANGIGDVAFIDEHGSKMIRLREKVRRVLEIGEDIGVAVEWMTRE